jgi:hypothetical protein
MKTKNVSLKKFGFLSILLIALVAIFVTTNCSKISNDYGSRFSKFKSSEDDLKSIFGSVIIDHMKINYDSAITDFEIIADTILCSNDTCILHMINIRCTGFSSKPVGCMVIIGDNAATVIKTCIGGCGPNGCAMTWNWVTNVVTCDCADPGYAGVCGVVTTVIND